MVDALRIHPGRYISIFKFLSSRKVRGVLVAFDMLDTTRIHQGSCISIFKSLLPRKVIQLLGSPMAGGDKQNVTDSLTHGHTCSFIYIDAQ